MAVTTCWDNEDKTVLRWDFDEAWTLTDFYEINEDLKTRLDQASCKINVLLDMTHNKHVPDGFMSALRSVTTRQQHPNMGVMVSIGNNMFIRSFVNLFTQIYPNNNKTTFYMASSYQDAYEFFNKHTIKPAPSPNI